ncbi:MAG: HAD hydrolase-like protein [Acidimicrobiales bacterium]
MSAAEAMSMEVSPPIEPDARPVALFDLDGTITDPADGIVSCHRWALSEIGLEIPMDVDTSTLIGPPVQEAYEMLGVPSDQMTEAVRLYRERFAIAGWLDDTAYPGVVELIEGLAGAGWVVGVATMKLEQFAARIIERVGLADHIGVVAGSDPARTRITKTKVIEHALEQLGSPTAGVAMIGDRRHDIEAARALGLTAIGVAWGFGSIEELMGANAHAIAVTPADVSEFLLG